MMTLSLLFALTLTADIGRIAAQTDAMTATMTGLNRIKSVLPAGATLAHKTGTMPGTLNDIGVITTPDGKHIAIAVFTKARTRSSEAQTEKVIAEVARAAYAELTR